MRNCPRCLNTAVLEDGYCGHCRECTMQALPVKRGTNSQQRVVSRHPLHWMIKDGDESVWLIRHRLDSAIERPLTDHERIIGFLCEQLMAANNSSPETR